MTHHVIFSSCLYRQVLSGARKFTPQYKNRACFTINPSKLIYSFDNTFDHSECCCLLMMTMKFNIDLVYFLLFQLDHRSFVSFVIFRVGIAYRTLENIARTCTTCERRPNFINSLYKEREKNLKHELVTSDYHNSRLHVNRQVFHRHTTNLTTI
jgi:hypothetical protein